MRRTIHKIYISSFVLVTLAVFLGLTFYGADYYTTKIDERYFHPQHELLKPTGLVGHGLGIAGSFLIVLGVFSYMARKRIRRFYRFGSLKYWLEFHIFLCTLGPVMILFHTSFKFGGLVAFSFWSMVAVVISGVIGRFIYLQIPRTIEGRELNLSELNQLKTGLYDDLKNKYNLDTEILDFFNDSLKGRPVSGTERTAKELLRRLYSENQRMKTMHTKLKMQDISISDLKGIKKTMRREMVLTRRIDWLSSMQRLFRYWHVAHLPFALIMLFIMVVHIIVAVLFGYKWIF